MANEFKNEVDIQKKSVPIFTAMNFKNYEEELGKRDDVNNINVDCDFNIQTFNSFNLSQHTEDKCNDTNKTFDVYKEIYKLCLVLTKVQRKVKKKKKWVIAEVLEEELDEEKYIELCDKAMASEYRSKKTYFERYHCKILQRKGIVRNRFVNNNVNDQVETFNYSTLKDNYANLFTTGWSPKGDITKESFVGKWLHDPEMRQYNFIEFIPPSKQMTLDNFMNYIGDDCERHKDGVYNTYSGFDIEKRILHAWDEENKEKFTDDEKESFKVQTKDNNIFLEHIWYLMGEDEASYNYYLDWWSHLYQYRATLPESAVVIISKEGVGKGTLTKLNNKLIGVKYIKCSPDVDNLFGTHSNAFQNKFLVIFEETSGTATFKYAERIKSIITDAIQTANEKYQTPIDYKQYCSSQFHSNNINGVVKVGTSDRRFFIVESSERMVGNTEYFTRLYDTMKDENELIKLYGYLMSRDLTDRLSRGFKDRPITEIYRNIKRSSIHNTLKFLLNLLLEKNLLSLEDKYDEIDINNSKLTKDYRKFCEKVGLPPSNITIMALRMKSYNGMSKRKTNKGAVWTINFKKIKAQINEIYEEDMFNFVEDDEDDKNTNKNIEDIYDEIWNDDSDDEIIKPIKTYKSGA